MSGIQLYRIDEADEEFVTAKVLAPLRRDNKSAMGMAENWKYWKSLKVCGASWNLHFLSPCRGFFDWLEIANVERLHVWGPETIDVFSVAPHLRSFTKTMKARFLLPANIVKFMDGVPFDADTRAILNSLVNIEHLSILCSWYSSGLPQIHLPRLSKLQLEVNLCSVGDAFVTYNHFELPFLTHLQMTLICSQTKIPTQVFQPISSSTVSSLVLTWFHCPTRIHSVSDIELDPSSLCKLPNLQCLTVKDCPKINLFLRALSVLPGKNMIFPKMSKLDIKSVSGDVLDMRILVELVQSRRDHGALRKFKITCHQRLLNNDAGIHRRWRRLSAPGAGIQISASIKGLSTN
ncbi:hypothetical protein EDD18DRAFT_1440519 [Armillaria luteobubalina]|uniref:Uncharacterized protein n=1 Tax=Armillaria luteobubalina TaxID=153913 RepID=A0AA39P903_9AGAR|nr:hypothetical protein EDD18DRAFT_1440519 [Armillaria luteobubalina]